MKQNKHILKYSFITLY